MSELTEAISLKPMRRPIPAPEGVFRVADMPLQAEAIVQGYEKSNKPYLDRLLAMGFTRGVKIQLLRVAPLGDPVDIRLRGYNITLRKEEAAILRLSHPSSR